jgi:hypothetical protein
VEIDDFSPRVHIESRYGPSFIPPSPEAQDQERLKQLRQQRDLLFNSIYAQLCAVSRLTHDKFSTTVHHHTYLPATR